ncbi:MAG: NAD(P)H-binding protein [Devosiaceae bacterium]
MRVLLFGATGTIGRATARALISGGHHVACIVRQEANLPAGIQQIVAEVTDPESLSNALVSEPFDAAISCLASRTGAPADAWAIDHQANLNALAAAKAAGAEHFVLLSAICVQKPLLAFQQAKLSFEAALQSSHITYSIVRPTAFFKSLSGQLDRVRAGKPFLVFGDGKLTACKPISDDDLADYVVGCLTDETRKNAVLPIGGPGAAITPLDQADALFALLGKEPKIKHVPVAMISTIIAVLSALGKLIPSLAQKAELARIGRYYATQSMLVWDAENERYDGDATPEHGTQNLFDYYQQLVSGQATLERGDHAVF